MLHIPSKTEEILILMPLVSLKNVLICDVKKINNKLFVAIKIDDCEIDFYEFDATICL